MKYSKKYKSRFILNSFIFLCSLLFITDTISAQTDEIIKSQISIEPFSKLKINGNCKIVLKESTEYNAITECQTGISGYVNIISSGDSTLEINIDRDLNKSKVPVIYLDFVTLKEITASGLVNIDCYTNFSAEYLNIITDFEAVINLYITSNNLFCHVSGYGETFISGKIYNLFIKTYDEAYVEINLYSHVIVTEITDVSCVALKGKTDLLHANIEKEGFLKAFELDAREAILNIKSLGAASVFVTEKVEKRLYKNSSASIRGKPKEVVDYNTKR